MPLIVEDDGVTINEALLIGQNTNPGLSSRGIGADNTGNLYFKTPTFNGHWYFQNNGGSANRTEFEILNQAIKIGEDNNSASDPTGNGEIKRVGTTLKAYVGGEVKDFADIGSGSGANAELSNLTDPTELNQGLSFEGGADTRVDSGAVGIGANTTNDLYINVPSNFDRVRFSGNGTSHTEIYRYGLKLPSFSTAVENTLAFSHVPGMIWYNTTTDTFRGREADDVIVDLSGGGSADFSAVAADIIPSGTSRDLGSESNRWDSVYLNGMYFGDETDENDRPEIYAVGDSLRIRVEDDAQMDIQVGDTELLIQSEGVEIDNLGFSDTGGNLTVEGRIEGKNTGTWSGSNPNDRGLSSSTTSVSVVRDVLRTLIADLMTIGILHSA